MKALEIAISSNAKSFNQISETLSTTEEVVSHFKPIAKVSYMKHRA
jgi:hypothetical protein